MFTIEEKHKMFLYPVVRIFSQKAAGSGTVICSDEDPKNPGEYLTFVLTNHHVIDDLITHKEEWDAMVGKKIEKEFKERAKVETFTYIRESTVDSSNRYDADIIAYDVNHDLAILKIDSPRKFENVAKLLPEDKIKALRLFMDVVVSGCSIAHEPFCNFGQLTFLKEFIDQKKFLMTNASSIFGNCLTGDSLITLCTGDVKPISEVETGDMVWAVEPNSGLTKHRVLETINSGKKDIFKVKTRTRTVKASDNHPFLVVEFSKDWKGNKRNRLEWKQLKDIKEEDIIAVLSSIPDKYKIKGLRIDDFVSQNKSKYDFMRLLGFYTGGGWIRERSDGYEFSLAVYNKDMKEKYESILNELFNIDYFGRNEDVINIYSQSMVNLIKDVGLVGKSTEKTIPSWIMSSPQDLQKAFIEGYLDADGYVNKLNDWVFEANNESLIKRLMMMCIHLGYNVSNIHSRMREETEINGRIAKPNSKSYSFQVYPQYSKSRNTHISGNVDDLPSYFSYERVSSIEHCGEEDTFDLKIEGAHNFFADGILVHNSGGALFLKDTGELIGVPSRISAMQLGFSVDIISWMGFAAHPERLYEFFKEQELKFLFDKTDNYYDAMERREDRKKKAMMDLKAELMGKGGK